MTSRTQLVRRLVPLPVRIAGPAVVTALALVALLGTACRPPATTTTTYADAAPVIARSCLPCHAEAGVSPPLETYEHAARAANAIVLAVERREMPPWGPDETGACGTFADARWLAADEIATLSSWARAGAPEGSAPAIPPSADDANDADDNAGLDAARAAEVVVVDPGATFTPALGAASRCWVVPALVAHDVVATRIAGGDGALRQDLYELDDAGALAAAQRADDADPAPGWSCPTSGPGVGRPLASWSWLTPVQRMPRGAGVRIPAAPLVLHARADLLATGLDVVVRPRLVLGLGAGPAAELVPVREATRAPGGGARRVDVDVTWQAPQPGQLWGVVPRMGSHGKALSIVVVHEGGTTCVGYFGHWRATLQQLYRRRQPIALRTGDVVRLTCTMNAEAVPVSDDDTACAADLLVASME